MKVYLGIDIGGTSVKIGAVSQDGDILTSKEYSVSFDNYQTPILDTVLSFSSDFIKQFPHPYQGIGVSATGQIDTEKGEVIGTAGHIPSYINSKIKDSLESLFNLKTTVVNDANCMLLGEQWLGKAKRKNHVVGITLGTGVGGGILVDGNILLGKIGIGGELGHMSIQFEGKKCYCGSTGCYEQYASTTALISLVQQRLSISDINGHWIFDNHQNPVVQQCLQEWIEAISIGIVSLTHIFNPELNLIGGGVSSQEELLIAPIRKRVLELTMPRFREVLSIESAQLKNNAGLLGAVYYHMSH